MPFSRLLTPAVPGRLPAGSPAERTGLRRSRRLQAAGLPPSPPLLSPQTPARSTGTPHRRTAPRASVPSSPRAEPSRSAVTLHPVPQRHHPPGRPAARRCLAPLLSRGAVLLACLWSLAWEGEGGAGEGVFVFLSAGAGGEASQGGKPGAVLGREVQDVFPKSSYSHLFCLVSLTSCIICCYRSNYC